MKASDELFELIRSLKKSEKGYFKKFTAIHIKGDKNNYTKLFEAIDKQKKYDEKKIKKALGEGYFSKHLPKEKNYLYNLILKSLRSYYTNSSIDKQLKDLLINVEILFKKELYKQCQRVLSKAKKIALRFEKQLALLEIIQWEKELAHQEMDIEKTKNYLSKGFKEEYNVLQKTKNAIDYKRYVLEMDIVLRQEGSRISQPLNEKLKAIIDNPLFKEQKRALTLEANHLYYTAHVIYHFLKKDFKTSAAYSIKSIQLLESCPEQLRDKIPQYFTALGNLLVNQLNSEKYSALFQSIKKVRTIALDYSSNEVEPKITKELLIASYNIELWAYVKTARFEQGLLIIPELIKELETLGNMIKKESEIVLISQISKTYFGAGNYRKALLWNNKLLNDKEKALRQDIYCLAKIFNLIIHFELRNEQFVEYSAVSTYRFLSKHNRLYKFENTLLHFIRKRFSKTGSRKKLIIDFKELKADLLAISKDPFEKEIIESFHFISWLESKIENKPFAEIIRRKMKKQ